MQQSFHIYRKYCIIISSYNSVTQVIYLGTSNYQYFTVYDKCTDRLQIMVECGRSSDVLEFNY